VYITLSTLRQSLRLAEDLTELDSPDAFAAAALPGLARLVGCDSVTYNEIGPAPGEVRAAEYPAGIIAPGSLDVFAAHVHEHPVVNHYRVTGDGRPAKVSDFLSLRRFHALGLYADFFRHIPVEHQIGVSLPGPEGQVVGLAFNRARGDFTEAERDLLALLQGHLAAALGRAHRRQRARQALAAGTTGTTGTAETAGTAETTGTTGTAETAGTAEAAAHPAGEALTERETEILRLVALGRTNVAVAHALDVSPRTVAKHLEHIYRKLDVTSRASAARTYAERQALADGAIR